VYVVALVVVTVTVVVLDAVLVVLVSETVVLVPVAVVVLDAVLVVLVSETVVLVPVAVVVVVVVSSNMTAVRCCPSNTTMTLPAWAWALKNAAFAANWNNTLT
jgi:hypothetical protein